MRLFQINLLQAIRYLGKHKLRTVLIICIISFALVSFTFSISLIWNLTHKESHFTDYKDIYRVQITQPDGLTAHSYYIRDSIACYILEHAPADAEVAIKSLTASSAKNTNDSIIHLPTSTVSKDFFNVIGTKFICGMPAKENNEIVLTEHFAMELFGTVDIIGKTVEIIKNRAGSTEPYRICGVLCSNKDSEIEKNWGAFICDDIKPVIATKEYYAPDYAELFIRTKSIDEVQQTLENVKKYYSRESISALSLVPLRMAELRRHNGTFWHSAFYQTVLVILSALLLISALFSYLAILNMSANSKWMELRVRISLGNGFSDTLRRLHAEVLLMFLGIGVMSAIMMTLGYNMFFGEENIAPEYVIMWFIGIFTSILLIMLILCLIPVIIQIRRNRKALSESPHSNAPVINHIMLVMQIAVSVFLIFLVWHGGRQIHYIKNDVLGLDTENVYIVDYIPHDSKTVQEKLSSYAAIESSVLYHKIFERGWMVQCTVDGFTENIATINLPNDVIQLFRIKPTLFKPDDKPFSFKYKNQILISSNAAKYYGVTVDNPYLVLSNKKYEVIGTLDICTRNLHNEPELICYGHEDESTFGALNYNEIYFRAVEGREAEAVAAAEEALQKHDIHNARIRKYSELIDKAYTEEQNYLYFYTILSCIGIGISILGLITIINSDLQRQRRSLAIKRIFGAKYNICVKETLRIYLFIVFIGTVIGIGMGYHLMTMWLAIYSDHISIGWIQSAIIVSGIAILVSSLVAYKVRSCFKENPIQAINS